MALEEAWGGRQEATLALLSCRLKQPSSPWVVLEAQGWMDKGHCLSVLGAAPPRLAAALLVGLGLIGSTRALLDGTMEKLDF